MLMFMECILCYHPRLSELMWSTALQGWPHPHC
jgi:hypothetical protein